MCPLERVIKRTCRDGSRCQPAAANAAFHDTVLAELGAVPMMEFGPVIGYGVPPNPDLWLAPLEFGDGFRESHIALAATSRALVQKFFQLAWPTVPGCSTSCACGPSITSATTGRSSVTPTATTSKRCATSPNDPPVGLTLGVTYQATSTVP